MNTNQLEWQQLSEEIDSLITQVDPLYVHPVESIIIRDNFAAIEAAETIEQIRVASVMIKKALTSALIRQGGNTATIQN